MAAGLVINNPDVYGSLDDVTSNGNTVLCIAPVFYQDFLEAWPETHQVLTPSHSSLEDIISEFDSNTNDSCDVAITSQQAFDSLATLHNEVCHKAELLYNKILLEVDNVIVS